MCLISIVIFISTDLFGGYKISQNAIHTLCWNYFIYLHLINSVSVTVDSLHKALPVAGDWTTDLCVQKLRLCHCLFFTFFGQKINGIRKSFWCMQRSKPKIDKFKSKLGLVEWLKKCFPKTAKTLVLKSREREGERERGRVM